MKKLLTGGKLFFLLMTVFSALFIFSCKSDNEEDMNAEFVCDLSDTKFSTTVEPILAASCYGCHGASSSTATGGGLVLEGYDAVFPYAENGTLYGTINWEEGFENMPPSGSKLSACKISQIKQWIDNGAMDN